VRAAGTVPSTLCHCVAVKRCVVMVQRLAECQGRGKGTNCYDISTSDAAGTVPKHLAGAKRPPETCLPKRLLTASRCNLYCADTVLHSARRYGFVKALN